jgi:CRISPR-associated protein Csm1
MDNAVRQQAQLAALSGLLHDVGKFWQRTSRAGVHPDFQTFTKEDFGQNGAHATFSAAFVKQYVPEQWRKAIMSGVFYHHRPSDEMSSLIALADHLSAAVDRTRSAEDNPKQMLSVFAGLGGMAGKKLYSPLHALELTESALMPAAPMADAQAQTAYAALWDRFAAEADRCGRLPSLEAYLEGLLSLFQQYTWCIPSAYYGSDPDISLYDHSRTTAALAAVLASADHARIQYLLGQDDGQPIATFIEGDISGIQKFIYTVPARGAAKQLRARSFYLQVLTYGIARRLLSQFGMPVTNLIYAGGGRFFILVPWQADTSSGSLFDSAQTAIDALLLRHHDGDLHVALGFAHLSASDFSSPERFSAKWREVVSETGRAKRQRYARLSPQVLAETVFAPRRQDAGELALRRADRDEVTDESDDNDAASLLGQSFQELARSLMQADFLAVEFFAPQQASPGGFNAVLQELGMRLHPIRSGDLGHAWRSPEPAPDVEYVLVQGLESAPSERDIDQIAMRWRCPVVSSLRWTVNVTAMVNQHRPATFDELQKAAEQVGAIRRLGVLRMDVDNLGELFASGFLSTDKNGKSASRASLARIANLSFSLGLFFEGWVGELCRRINQQYVAEIDTDEEGHFSRIEAIYAVYSGGDDLFIVGRWDVLPRLAEQIRDHFRAYGCDNPGLSISAGITLHGGKYPLYQAAEEAGNALEAAKLLPGKDGITFLGQTVKWAAWPAIVNDASSLLTLVRDKNAPRAILQTLQQLHGEYMQARRAMKTNASGSEQIPWGPYQWRAAYQFARLADRYRSFSDELNALHDRLTQSNFSAILELGLAARWIEAMTRRERKE